MRRIIITGGTGYIGSALIQQLVQTNELLVLSRHLPAKRLTNSAISYGLWDGKSEITEKIEGADVLINLCGANIGERRWTPERRLELINSRVVSTKALARSIDKAEHPPTCWIQASACGYYGNSREILTEQSAKGSGFLSDLCQEWEAASELKKAAKVRKVIIRTGVVVSPEAQIVRQLQPTRFNIAFVPGSGNQHLPWIRLQDQVNAIAFLINHPNCEGVFNLIDPQAGTLNQFVDGLAFPKTMIKCPIPTFLLNILLGKDLVDGLVIADQQIKPQRLLDAGFVFTK